LHEGVPAPFEVEVQLRKRSTPIYSKENGLELKEAAEVIGLTGGLFDLFL
jgi:hypothetical protein